tara:strand:+ start:359 stop:769 length:411 start_codon:yes stop_codon:yes gene_type:complete
MTMIRTWFESTLSQQDVKDLTKDAMEHLKTDTYTVGDAITLLRRYLNKINIEIVPPVGSSFSRTLGKKAYPLRVTGLRFPPNVDEYYGRKHRILNSLADVSFTDHRVARKVTVKPMGYAHTNPIPLKRRCVVQAKH